MSKFISTDESRGEKNAKYVSTSLTFNDTNFTALEDAWTSTIINDTIL